MYEYHLSDKLTAAGYLPLGQIMIAEAFARGKDIELMCDSPPGGAVPVHLRVRSINGRIYAMMPRNRKMAVQPAGQPAKIIA